MGQLSEKVPLGRSNLRVSRLGLGSSYGAPTAAYEEAFERGVNYFYWGSRRSDDMGDAIRHVAKGRREDIVVVLQSYARPLGFLVKQSVQRGLRSLGLDYADVLLLGWYNDVPSRSVMDAALGLVERGLVRHIALSGHRRTLFPDLISDRRIDVWHLRYNAVHRGAEREVFPSLDGLSAEERPGVVTYTTTRWGHLVDPGRTPKGERTPTGTDCYRFALSHPHVDVAIAGPANVEQTRQALQALELGTMDEEEIAWMRRVGDGIYGKDRTSGIRD
ncbi:MAG: aldo/keto reductase [Polyangiaceae bacterium]|nr:aldo/keto reductase [Polyangiaceae bacterium]